MSFIVSSFEGEKRKPKGAVLFTGEVGGARFFTYYELEILKLAQQLLVYERVML